MSFITRFLYANRDRLHFERYGIHDGASAIVLTPRFESSRHAVFLITPNGAANATLVAKVPRIAGDHGGLTAEAAILEAAQGSRPGGYRSIPRLVAFAEHDRRIVLVQTLLPGRPMDRRTIRRSRTACVDAVVAWLLDLPRTASIEDPGWYDRLVVRPLRAFAARFPARSEEAELVLRTLQNLEPLAAARIPLVLEHGDLADPNLLLGGESISVIDWELAEQRGLPAHDLFFFLGYVVLAALKSDRQKPLLQAFDRAFDGTKAWARPVIDRYSRAVGLAPELMRPLFVACWARYTAKLVERVAPPPATPASSEASRDLERGLRHWLRENRNYVLWRYSLDRLCHPQWLLQATH